jgi:hypothetical protein
MNILHVYTSVDIDGYVWIDGYVSQKTATLDIFHGKLRIRITIISGDIRGILHIISNTQMGLSINTFNK